MLTTPEAWEWLTADDHALLAQEPPPLGSLFAWLEAQWLEHGPQPWAALREGLRGQPFEALAVALHDSTLALQEGAPPDDEQARADLRRELRELLRRLRIEHLKAQETALLARSASDPAALAQYRRVQAERLALQEKGEMI
ncbi:hypothetical protein Tsedi_02100 [Tepidimonas sediminis]|uniref:DNA primase n=1 Tax=Tepidimonas sediminis TaxID=2588941 RepID=A0A554WJV0_9BURK|nr:hypothetical protein Tsedi_02100 [Tepidimonas sediminis]